jgi:hypothetical protein
MCQTCHWFDTARSTLTDGAYWWLHAKPLNATTGQVLVLIGPVDAIVVVVVIR